MENETQDVVETTQVESAPEQAPEQEQPAQEEALPNALGEAQPEEQAPVETAPEAYEAFVDADGKAYDENLVKGFSEVARELNLSQENAQKVFGSVVPAAREYLRQDLV